MGSVVLSVRVRRELKEEAEKLGINIREVVEKALEEAVRRAKRERILEDLRELGRLFAGMSEEDWIRIIREIRETRASNIVGRGEPKR